MKKTYLSCLIFPSILLMGCQKDEVAGPVLIQPQGVEINYPVEGTVGQHFFSLYLQNTDMQAQVGETGYTRVWTSTYERNTQLSEDGSFYFKFEFPLDIPVRDAFAAGPLGKGLDYYYWTLEAVVPAGESNDLICFRAFARKTIREPAPTRSEEVYDRPQILERSDMFLDHLGQPYFNVTLQFKLPVVCTSEDTEAAYLLEAEGKFRVPVKH